MKQTFLFLLALAPFHAQCEVPDLPATPFPLADVRLLDGPFRDAQERGKNYLLRIEVGRLMHWFRVNAGLPSASRHYKILRLNEYDALGQYEGHHLTGCALMFAGTGDPRFKQRVDEIVNILAECQNKIGTGFIAAFSEHHMRVYLGWEQEPDPELRKLRLRLPWYHQHKLYTGLLNAYLHADNTRALNVLNKALAWEKTTADRLGDVEIQNLLAEEHGGIAEAFANAYAVTRNPDHLDLARRFCHRAMMDPLARNEDILDGIHANTQIPKFVGFARLFQLTGDSVYGDSARNFWTMVTRDRTYVTGGNSNHEFFSPKAHLSHEISRDSTETCNTYNMRKLKRYLFELQPFSHFADFDERALYNHILSSQNPADCTVCGYHNLQNGNRKFGQPNPSYVSLACCAASGQENPGKYAESIYFHKGSERLFVNLFIASELNWKDAGISLRQQTDFPAAETSTLTLSAAKPMGTTISFRKPFWAKSGFSVSINGGASITRTSPEGYVDIHRTWNPGDEIKIHLPMTFRWEGFRDNPRRAAILCGPLVMVAKTTDGSRLAAVHGAPEAALASIKPGSKPLRFSADPEQLIRSFPNSKPVELLPLHEAYQDPYIVYWDQIDDVTWKNWKSRYAAEAERWKRLAPRTLDCYFPGAGTPAAGGSLQGQLAGDPAFPSTAGTDDQEKSRMLRIYTGWQRSMNQMDIEYCGPSHAARTTGRGSRPWFGVDMKVRPGSSIMIRLWTPPAGDPTEKRGTDAAMELRVLPVKSAAMPQDHDNDFKQSTVIGDIEPAARADGSFRDLTFSIPPTLAATGKVTVICAPQPKRIMGIVTELRILTD